MDCLRKKILFVMPRGTGGAQKVTALIAKFLPTTEYDVRVLIVGKKDESDMAYLIPPHIPIDYLIVKNVWMLLTLRLFLYFIKFKPQVVFSSIMYLNVRVILATKFLRNCKVVVRNDNMLRSVKKSLLLLLKCTYPMADRIVAQQDEMKKDLIENLLLKEDKVFVINNPIDLEDLRQKANEFNPYKDWNYPIIKYVWTGNFMESGSKGQDVLIKAFYDVFKQNPKAHLFLLGMFFPGSSYHKEILRYIEDHELTENVHILGYQKNPYPWIKHSDCFVLPSRVEGLPNALIEAMYLSKPVVATKCVPVIERIVKNEKNGYLVPSDDPVAMADAMKKALLLKNFEPSYSVPTIDEIKHLFDL